MIYQFSINSVLKYLYQLYINSLLKYLYQFLTNSLSILLTFLSIKLLI